jgi:hypothetical protein
MTRYLCPAIIALSLGLGSAALAQSSRTLEDGTLVVSPLVVAAEMLVDENKAKRKYAGKALQIQGPVTAKLVTARGLDLTIMVQPPGYVGYKKFWCRSSDKSSEVAAEALPVGQQVTIVGIYQPVTRGDTPVKDITESSGAEKSTDWNAQIRLDSCIVLTGNPEGEDKRGIIAAKAAGGQGSK